jgi:hypothetical protein
MSKLTISGTAKNLAALLNKLDHTDLVAELRFDFGYDFGSDIPHSTLFGKKHKSPTRIVHNTDDEVDTDAPELLFKTDSKTTQFLESHVPLCSPLNTAKAQSSPKKLDAKIDLPKLPEGFEQPWLPTADHEGLWKQEFPEYADELYTIVHNLGGVYNLSGLKELCCDDVSTTKLIQNLHTLRFLNSHGQMFSEMQAED